MKKVTNQTILERGVAEVIKKDTLKKRLESGQRLRVKYGIDPTARGIHLGHLVPIRKLRQFQRLGHKVIFLIGDFTAKIGDPSGRSKIRPELSDQEIKENEKTYLDQIKDVVDLKEAEVRHNSEWFGRMSFAEILKLASRFSLSRIIERDDFQQRIKKGQDVRYHEGLYPIMQAYDSVVLKADVEIGGTDQKFNLLAGRNLQQQLGQEPQDVVMMPILTGIDGKAKMSQSLGNYIGIKEKPESQYGKIMSLPDELMVEYFHLATDLEDFELKEVENELELGENPKEIKKRLAYAIVTELHNKRAAQKAENYFELVFEQGKMPTQIAEVKMKSGLKEKIADLLVELKMASSKAEARRLVKQGGVRVDQATISDPQAEIAVHNGMIVNVGKLRYKRIICR